MGNRGRKLTKKRMADRRFWRTERLILEVFARNESGDSDFVDKPGLVNFSAKKMMKKIGRSRATFYLHHGGIMKIARDWEEYILEEYRGMVREKVEKKFELKGLVYSSLVFVIKNREVFRMLLERRAGKIFEGMVKEILECFEEAFNFKKMIEVGALSEIRFAILEGEIVTVFREWGKSGFSEEKISRMTDEVVFLIKTARKRLGNEGNF